MKLKGKPMGQAVEKRAFNRFEFQKPVQVFSVLPSKSGNILEVESRPFKGKLHDISEGGLRVAVPKKFSANSILKLHFKIHHPQAVEVYGKIIWAQKKLCGIRFVLTDDLVRKGVRAIGRKKTKSK